LVAKIAGAKVVNNASNLLTPRQLGYGISGGAEAAVHATRLYLDQLQPDHALIKLDFRNAFNSVRRDKMLKAAQDLVSILLSTQCTPHPPHTSWQGCTYNRVGLKYALSQQILKITLYNNFYK